MAELRQTFRPEFLNRIDDIVTFKALTMENIEPIVELQLEDVRKRLAQRVSPWKWVPALWTTCASRLRSVYGARPLKRLIQRNVVDTIATAIVSGQLHDGDKSRAQRRDGMPVASKRREQRFALSRILRNDK